MYFLLVLFVHSLEISPIFPSLTPPTARRLLTAAYYSINNSVYLFGGGRNTDDSYTNTVWRYDLSLFQWKKIDFNSPVAPSPRIGAAGSIYLDFIFIYGGESDNGPSADMWKFDLTRLLWTEIGKSPDWPLETSFSAYCTFEFKGSAYMAMFGGMQSEGPGHDLYLFDLAEIQWILMPGNGNVPKNRMGAGIDYFESAIYMWGTTEGEYEVSDSQHFYKYDLNLLVWTELYPSGNEPGHRSFHGVRVVQEYFYLFLGFDFTTNSEVKNVFRTSLTGNLAWEEVAFSGDLIAKHMFASVLLNDSVWIFCGNTISQLTNSVEKIDFANKQVTAIYPNSVMPKQLHGYTFDRFSNSFLMFGGSDMESKYNSFYILTLDPYSWDTKKTTGNSPSPRYRHSSTMFNGIILIIFGGANGENLLNDFFIYNCIGNSWTKLSPSSTPEARSGSCMTSTDKYIIIHGGNVQVGITSELLFYDMYTNELITAREVYTGVNVNLTYHHCWIDQTGAFFLASGEKKNSQPSTAVYKGIFEISESDITVTWQVVWDQSESILIGWSESAVLVMGDWFIQVGGSRWGFNVSPYVSAIFLNQAKLPLQLSSDSNHVHWYRHRGIHYARNIFTGSSGAMYGNIIKRQYLTSQIYKISPSDYEKEYFPCSQGTFGENCMECPKGTYSDTIGALSCNKCPSGSYGPFIAATSLNMCLPCPFGQFSDREGSYICLQCSSYMFCPVWSSKSTELINFPAVTLGQPPEYSYTYDDPFNGKIYYLAYFIGTFLFLLYLTSGKFRKVVLKLDYFTSNHDTGLDEPIIHRKTVMGGLFTLIFLIFIAIYLSNIFLSYTKDNIIETKALVPSVTLTENYITSQLSITVELFYYPGACIGESANNCSMLLYTDFFHIKGTTNCYKIDSTCVIEFLCQNCEMTGNAYIEYSICEYGSMATGMRVNVSSDSSIPNYTSSTSYFTILSDGNVFRGRTSTAFYFEITPSLFLSQSDKWPNRNTGYHVAPQGDPIFGSVSKDDEIYLENCVGLITYLEVTNAVLVTNRTLKFNLLLILSAAIGSIFGFLQLFAIGMLTTEKFDNGFRAKLNRLARFAYILRNRVSIAGSFKYLRERRTGGIHTLPLNLSLAKAFPALNFNLRKIMPSSSSLNVSTQNNIDFK